MCVSSSKVSQMFRDELLSISRESTSRARLSAINQVRKVVARGDE